MAMSATTAAAFATIPTAARMRVSMIMPVAAAATTATVPVIRLGPHYGRN